MNLRPALLTVLATTAVLAAGCTARHHAAPRSPLPAPVATNLPSTLPAPHAAAGSATTVALHDATLLFAANTVTDANWNATWAHHSTLLTAGFAQQLAGTGPGSSDASWQVWASHEAHLQVSAQLISDDQPADTSSVALRHVELTLTPSGVDGWHGAPTQLGVVLTLDAVNGTWLVGGIHVDI